MASSAAPPLRITPRYLGLNLVVRALSLARRHYENQLLGAAITSVVGSFQSSPSAVACWVADREMELRLGVGVSVGKCIFALHISCYRSFDRSVEFLFEDKLLTPDVDIILGATSV